MLSKIALILCLGCFLFSCRSKKAIVAKKPNTTTVVIGDNKEETKKTPKTSTKVYANATEKYIDVYQEIAQHEMDLYGIPASITLAQGILESGSGKGRLSVKANNHFGIKCHGWTGAKIYHDDDRAQECFRKYKDAKYSFRDHSLFLKDRKRYAKLFKLKKGDYKGWARELRAAGYATDKKYPQKLISIIERYELYNLDKGVLVDSHEGFEMPTTSESETITYTVAKGDTLYSISRKYNVTVNDLQKLNGLNDTALSIGQVLVVKP
ncbi:glucosaminidase domain-containing protein [Flavivirga abyssicola]|uniref:glucosaminidase domain-containing protein n=1 Tax=Flavivirga abyssicola TaxID=3063533 RepID=UPI0026DEDA8D|nr:glucosaminidase domain-containing protein [Flavivirga sp. MEBiC07777]WVK15341.1 glucosaminidase domain-containing protein [Flavivirga sp. MEBiC07777]